MKNTNEIIYDQAFDVDNLNLEIIETSLILDQDQQNKVDLKWLVLEENAIKNNLTLYNGESYRLESFNKNGINNSYDLKLSKINFKERICLEKLSKNQENKVFSKGLAIGCFMQTADEFFIFGKMSGKTMSDDKIDFIGGVADSDIETSAKGLWGKFLQEMKEEASIDEKYVKYKKYLGFVKPLQGNIILLTYCKLSLSKDEVLDLFNTHHDNEILGLDFVYEDSLELYLNSVGCYKPKAYQLLIKFLSINEKCY